MKNIVDPNSAVPLYKQILNILMDKINSGEYKTGERLPSENRLMQEYSVSRITIRTALNELVDDGILSRVQGKGTYVAEPKEQYRANDQVGFSRSCYMDGKKPSSKLIKIEYCYPSKSQMEFFRISEKEKIICTRRLRYVNDVPTLIETNHYPAEMDFLFTENLEGSLFELMNNKYNIHIANSIRTLEICYPTKEEMELLNLDKNVALILFKDKHYDKCGMPLWLSKQVYCSEHMKFYL